MWHHLELVGKRVSLTDKYELRTPLSGSTAIIDQSLEGQQKGSGRQVNIHLLAGGSRAQNEELLRAIEMLPPMYRVCFLEVGEHNGHAFVVTDALAAVPPFRKWFAGLQARAHGTVLPEKAKQEHAENMSVRAWQIPVGVNPIGSVELGVKPTVSDASSAKPGPAAIPSSHPEPGEFTSLFQSPSAAQTPTAQNPSAPARTAEPEIISKAAAPGEFTQLFQTPSSKNQQPIPWPTLDRPETAPEPGEFTRMFRTSPAPEPGPAPPSAPVTRQAANPKPSSDEFTELFAAIAPPGAPSPGEFTQMFPATGPEPLRSLTPYPKPAPAAPGEFTQFFQAPTSPVAEPAVTPPASAPVEQHSTVGEFTQLFAAPAQQVNPPAPKREPIKVPPQANLDVTLLFQVPPRTPAPAPQPATPPKAAPASTPGEFTQMFAPARPAAPRDPQQGGGFFEGTPGQSPIDFPQSPERPRNEPQPGEFTRMMESPMARAGLKPQPFAPAAPLEEKQRPESGFTRMMEAMPASAPEAHPPAKHAKGGGDATRAFHFPNAGQPSPPAETTGPSEFTNMFKAPTKEPVRAEPKPAPKPARVVPRKKQKQTYMKWVLVGSAILLIVVIVLYFVL